MLSHRSSSSSIGDRLLSELRLLAPASDVHIRIFAPKERKFTAWIGGSILSHLPTFSKMWVSASEYQEEGSTVVRVFETCALFPKKILVHRSTERRLHNKDEHFYTQSIYASVSMFSVLSHEKRQSLKRSFHKRSSNQTSNPHL